MNISIPPKVQSFFSGLLDAASGWFSSWRRLWATVFFSLLALSLAFLAFYPGKTVEVVLFFPQSIDHKAMGERRVVPLQTNTERAVEQLAREIALGPVSIMSLPIIPSLTRVRSVFVRSGKVFIDFDEEMALNSGCPLGLKENIALIQKTISYNYPGAGKVIVTIAGNEPFADQEVTPPSPETEKGKSSS